MKEKKLASIVLMQTSVAKPEELAKLNVNILARLHGVSAPNLSRAFKKHYSIRLGAFLQYLRIVAFEDLMKKNPYMHINAALKILDIRSSSHFGQQYKKCRHMTPYEMALKCQLEKLLQERTSA
ncbi:MAG: Helix-turn-helix protein [Acidobacteriota bacterium]|nr:Helix-turn-helix protein [Acidobacteriota bacterium]